MNRVCNQEVEDCNAVPNAGTSMWTPRVLSIIVKICRVIGHCLRNCRGFFSFQRANGTSKRATTKRTSAGVSRISSPSVTPSDGVGSSSHEVPLLMIKVHFSPISRSVLHHA
jgi:hypothetical protein